MTEVGVIPEDWEINSFKDVSWVNQGLQIAIEKRLKRPTQKSKKYITIQFLNNSKEVEYIDNYVDSVCCNKDDVLMTRTGNTGIVVTGVEGVFHNNFFKINFDRKRINKDYLVYYLNQSKLKEIILIKAGTSTIPDLNHNDFYSIPIVLPKLSEQKAIVEALSDIDNLITSLEKLIDKKQKIKQGTMQQLLTGKKRLPGFTGEWEVKKLGDLGEISAAGVDKKINPNEMKVRLLNFLDVYHKDFIYSKDLWHEVTSPKTKLERCAIRKGDVFFTPSSEMRNDIAFTAVSMEDINDAVYSYHVVRFRFREKWDLKFKSYIFKTRFFFNQAETFCEGSGKRYVISLKKFRELEIYYPIDLKEQQAIANILYDMDSEIEALEKKLEKYKAIKQGMMQELLTGRIRLV
ncbi:MAG: restriction endonuclease subunit S [Mollicutes bacterium]|nr:restriction endonuclease subunit S [Mollicutes bacterium]